MSPSNINSFVGDLVQMATAFENLPKIEQERDELKQRLDNALGTIQARELAILDYKADIAELNNKVRSLEVERDDASFRVLEAEDKAVSVLRLVRSAQASLADSVIFLDPPKPESKEEVIATSEAMTQVPQAQPVTTPAEGSSSEPLPTQEQKSEQTSVTSSANENTTSAEPTHGPYFGKRYIDVEGYISRSDWHNGGGTDEDYDWRPEAPRAYSDHSPI